MLFFSVYCSAIVELFSFLDIIYLLCAFMFLKLKFAVLCKKKYGKVSASE